jgi:2'-5' RNA ligase
MSKIRAFLALNLPVAVVEEVRGLQSELREEARTAGMKVSWVPAPNMHVTLRFLGDVQEEVASAILDTLQKDLAGTGTLMLEVKGLGVFPDPAKPRVIWVGVVSAEDVVAALAKKVDGALERLGFEPESRPFHAHLTLGRVKHGGGVQPMLDAHGDAAFGQCSVHEVVLYKSVLQRSGAEYTALGRVPLGGRS